MRASSRVPSMPLVGILVGGKSRRMGRTKGLMSAPDGSGLGLVERLARQVEQAFPNQRPILLGSATGYEHLDLGHLEDARPDCGPLGGIVSLARFAVERGVSSVIVLGSDLPYLDAAMMRRLALDFPESTMVCPQLQGYFFPLAARLGEGCFEELERRLERGQLSLQPVARKYARPLELTRAEATRFRDWDTPEDAATGPSS